AGLRPRASAADGPAPPRSRRAPSLRRRPALPGYAHTAIRHTLPILELLRYLLDVFVALLSVILPIPLLPGWLRLSALLNTHDDAGAASAALLAASLLLPAALLLACPTQECSLGQT
ncbi:hypothetical protein T484DRAFT_1901917, partial [Baffinella frigidus]